MASSDDAASRFSSALDEVFADHQPKQSSEQPAPVREPTQQPMPVAEPAPEQPAPPEPMREQPAPVPKQPTEQIDAVPTADWSVDDEPASEPPDAEPPPVALPKIVAATAHTPIAEPGPAPQPSIPAARTAPVEPSAPPVIPIPAQPRQDPASAPAATPSKPVAGWGDHMASTPTAPVSANLRAPGRRPRVRKVTRVVRHIDPWSTFKVALLFSLVAYVVTLTSGVLLWRVADSTGTLANIERWFTQFGWETFELKGGEVFHNAWIIGLFGAVALTGALVLLATLFNLVSDIVGGIRMTVLEEEVVERTVSSTRRYVVRRPPVGTAAPGGVAAAADWDVDADDDEPPATTATATVTGPSGDDTAEHPSADWSVDDY